MTQPKLADYAENSAEAILRIIAMFVIVDGEVADTEMDTIQQLGLLDALGVDRERFALVFDRYCDDLIQHAGTSHYVALADPAWLDAMLAPVTDPDRRRFTAAALLKLAHSDGRFADAEAVVLGRLLDRWGIDLESLVPEGRPST